MTLGSCFVFVNFCSFVFSQIVILGNLGLTRNVTEGYKLVFFGSLTFYFLFGFGYTLITTMINFQFKGLNQMLSKLHELEDESNIKEIMREVRRIHDTLYDTVDAISSYFVITCWTFLLKLFFFGIFASYTVFVYFNDPNPDTFHFSIAISNWFFLYVPFNIYTATISAAIENKAKDTIEILGHSRILKKSTKFIKSFECLVQQSMHRRPVLSFGLLEIDWKENFTVLNGIFSFSIILIQFYDVKK
jgi:hypothetical protein